MGRYQIDVDEDEEDDNFCLAPGQGTWTPDEANVSLLSREETTLALYPDQSLVEGKPGPGVVQHVHHYYYQTPPSPRKTSSSTWVWRILVGFGLLVAWLAQSPPPAPPPNDAHDSWSEYWQHHLTQLRQSAVAVLVDTPFYLTRWKVQSWQAALTEIYQEWTQLPACSMEFVLNGDATLKEAIVGQDLAIEMTTDAVHAWWQATDEDKSSPLVLLLVGYPHVGKRTLAQTMADKVFFRSCSGRRTLEPVLLLQWAEFVESRPETVRARLSEQIQTYARARRHGFLIVTDVDQLDPITLQWLLKECLEDELGSLHRVILVLTSDVWGTQSIARHLRQSESLQPTSRARLTADLAYELDPHVRGAITGVVHVPFGPLQKVDLEFILNRQLQQKLQTVVARKMHMTPAVLSALLDERHVEYLQWNRGESSPFLTVALEGAKVLQEKSPLWNKLNAQIARCSIQGEIGSADRSLVLDASRDGRYAIFGWCSDPLPREGECPEVCRFLV